MFLSVTGHCRRFTEFCFRDNGGKAQDEYERQDCFQDNGGKVQDEYERQDKPGGQLGRSLQLYKPEEIEVSVKIGTVGQRSGKD